MKQVCISEAEYGVRDFPFRGCCEKVSSAAIIGKGAKERSGPAYPKGGLARMRVARLYWHFPDRIYDGERRIRSTGASTRGRFLLRVIPAGPFRRSAAAGYRRTSEPVGQMDEGARFRVGFPPKPASGLHLPQTSAGHFRRLGFERAEPPAHPIGPAAAGADHGVAIAAAKA